MARKFILPVTLGCLFTLVGVVFWQQELKYLKPTPVPAGYLPVETNQTINLSGFRIQAADTPLLLHFFNPECPCSRFGAEHFASLAKAYGDQVAFYMVLQQASDSTSARKLMATYQLNLPLIIDAEEALATRCGVYATPQAVILDKDQKLYYRGNYNRSRYCTDKTSSFAQQALAAITSGQPVPPFSELATTAYGCQLSEQSSSLLNF